MTGMLDGPRRAPIRGGRADSLVVLLHGYGANGEDLIGLAELWARQLPNTAFIAPHAPELVPGMPGARQWFALASLSPEELERGVERAKPGLEGFLAGELTRAGLDDDRLVLVGFSQGTMMALGAGLARTGAPAGIVGYSGVLAGEPGESAAARPPVLLVHGDRDEVIPVGALAVTREALAAAGVPVEWHVRPGLGHGIDEEGIALAGRFMKLALTRPLAR